jgi:type IV pilus assembly protein PilV
MKGNNGFMTGEERIVGIGKTVKPGHAFVKSQSGFSLIEVIVSSFIMSIGALSMISLQLTSIGGTHNSQLRSMAVVMVDEMAQRMRNNRAVAIGGSYVTDAGSNGVEVSACNEAGGCTGTDLARHDIWEWYGQVVGVTDETIGLPAGNGSVVDNGDGSFTIAVSWVETKGLDPGVSNEQRLVSQRIYL